MMKYSFLKLSFSKIPKCLANNKFQTLIFERFSTYYTIYFNFIDIQINFKLIQINLKFLGAIFCHSVIPCFRIWGDFPPFRHSMF